MDEINELTTKLNSIYHVLKITELTKNQNLEAIIEGLSIRFKSLQKWPG